MGSPGHGVRRLAAAGYARERKMFRRITPHDIALFPGDAEGLRARAVDVDHGLRSQISNSGLEADPAIGRDDEKSVEADGATDVAAKRYADPAYFGADPFGTACHPLLPLELLRAALQRFFQECAGRVLKPALHRRPVERLAFRTVDVADRYLVHSEMPGGFRDNRFDDRNALHSARGTLRTAWGRVRQYGYPAPAHGLWLVQQRDHTPRSRSVALCVVRTVVRDHEHVKSKDPSFFGKPDLHSTLKTGPRASDKRLLLAADAHHHGGVGLLR